MNQTGAAQRVYSRIAGTGSYLPENVVTNDDLAKIVDTSDEWIAARTGIRQRHIAAEGETTSDLSYHASMRALEAAGATVETLEESQLSLFDTAAQSIVVNGAQVQVFEFADEAEA